MKTIKNLKRLFAYMIAATMVWSCQPDEFPEIGDPINRIEQMEGTWVMSLVNQFDDDAIRKGFPGFATQQNITNEFPFRDFRITLELSSGGRPTNFRVQAGNSPNILGGLQSGQWTVDDLRFPSKITFSGTGGGPVTLDISSLRDLDNNIFTLRIRRFEIRQGQLSPFLTYNYRLTKAN
jgi:hypothetical protein